MKVNLRELIGFLPQESDFKNRMRVHQGWWRTFVLSEPQGEHPCDKSKFVCSTINNGKVDSKNFLTKKIFESVREALLKRKLDSKGLIEENRLYNNLLSSQALCFNFFGELLFDKKIAFGILKHFYPQVTEILEVHFEFAPPENYTDDNSAFDVAFEVRSGEKSGFIGLECKYTDSFSPKKYDKPIYRQIFKKSHSFKNEYEEYIDSQFNQLFRNQLIAESLLLDSKYNFVNTGLFCHHDDLSATKIAQEFQSMLNVGKKKFKIITYRDFIEIMQKLDLTWEQRELSMLLWARYCGLKLSEQVSKNFISDM